MDLNEIVNKSADMFGRTKKEIKIHKKSRKEISHNKGILYDPEVVDACLTLFNEKGFQLA